MTFEQLNYFLEVVKDMNFTKAANRLFISQSTLSRHVTALEESLNTKLLNRDTHSVKLTEAGKFLVREGSDLLKMKREIEEKIWMYDESSKERLNFVMYLMQDDRVYHICNELKEKDPNILLNLSLLARNENIISRIQDGGADMGISTYGEIDVIPEDIGWVPLWEDEYYLIAPNNHRLACRDSVSVNELEDERILIADEPAISNNVCANIHHYLEKGTNRRYNVTQPRNIAEMAMQVMAGAGLAVLPGVNCFRDGRYKLLHIEGVPTKYDVMFMWKKDSPKLASIDRVREFFISSLAEMEQSGTV